MIVGNRDGAGIWELRVRRHQLCALMIDLQIDSQRILLVSDSRLALFC